MKGGGQENGILVCVIVYAVGSGLTEVLGSPIIEACPFDNKEGMMSLLHSFYCWGSAGVILGSTLFFVVFGIESWRILAVIWALIPLYNILNFVTCPIENLIGEGQSMTMGQLFKTKIFWLFIVLMAASGILCLCCYLLAGLSDLPIMGLIGCAVCGFSVGVMWPGSISISSKILPTGGTAMFALLALAGDLGGAVGPAIVGNVSQRAGDNLQTGVLAGIGFPIVLVICALTLRKKYKS